jgi:septum formation protein
MMGALVLASASPRRAALLRALHLDFVVTVPDVDERMEPGEDPRAYVQRLAAQKAATAHAGGVHVIAADTAVVLDDAVLGKPTDPADATRMLRLLSGRTHTVLTGLALADDHGTETGYASSSVHFAPLSDALIAWYVGTGEPLDKAGAYGMQDGAALFVEGIEGSPSNVIGLPLELFGRMAKSRGWPLPWA